MVGGWAYWMVRSFSSEKQTAAYLEILKVGYWVFRLHSGLVMVPQTAMVESYGKDCCLGLRSETARH